MIIPTPKFVVGEQVFAKYDTIPSTKTEITNRKFYKSFTWTDGDVFTNVWIYQTLECKSPRVREEQLQKLPPEDRISWEDCEFNPNKIEETGKC